MSNSTTLNPNEPKKITLLRQVGETINLKTDPDGWEKFETNLREITKARKAKLLDV